MTRFKVSLSEIAKRAGVSVSAVSLALRNSPKVSEAKKKLIIDIADQLGYVQDPRIAELMQHLRSNRGQRRTASLGVIIPELKTGELNKFPPLKLMLKGIELRADKMGYGVDTFVLEDLQARSERIKGILDARGINGVIVLPYKKGVEKIDLDFSGFSTITGGYSIVEPNINRVVPNYLQMMDEILEQLCSLGYKRIGMIMTYSQSGGGNGRKLFLSSLFFYQSIISQKNVIPILPNRHATTDGIKDWIDRHQPDVIISSAHIMEIIQNLGYQIPEQMGFVSIDLSEQPNDIAGVDHRWDLVGNEAVRILISSINSGEKGIPKQPKVLLIDSHFREGPSIKKVGPPVEVQIRNIPR